MRSFPRKCLGGAGPAALVALVLAACSSESTTPSTGAETMSDMQADVVISDVDETADFSTVSGSGAANLMAGPTVNPGLTLAVAAAFGQQCTPAPTKSPTDPANSDADPVPDSVRFTFDPPCILSRPLQTITRSGIVDLLDPTPTVTDFSREVKFTDFTKTWDRIVSGKTTSEKRNGTRVITGDANALQHSVTGFRTDYTFNNGSTASHVRTWSSAFTADVPGSIQNDAPLPDGTWNVTGTSTWSRGSKSWTFNVTTNPVLHYNASCDTAPRFDAGVMHVVVTDNQTNQSYTITITFVPGQGGVGCGDPQRATS